MNLVKLFSLLSILLIFLFPGTQAQQHPPSHEFCGSSKVLKHRLEQSQTERLRHLSFDQQIYDHKTRQQGTASKAAGVVYSIPVVVHIIHAGGANNISNAQVNAAIAHLNDAYRNVGFYNPATGVDVEVEFCLATQDAQGNPSTGINRVFSAYTNLLLEVDELAMKNLSREDPTQFVNIWIVDKINSVWIPSGLIGYAYPPSYHGSDLDGIVIKHDYFGTANDSTSALVHEMGHYLGLYHTFENACANNDCLADGDQICDTPPDNATGISPCGLSYNSCTTDEDDLSVNNPFRPLANGGIGDQDDMANNYMDYSRIACYNAFTQGQKDRMRLTLEGPRISLLNSLRCGPPCLNPIVAGFNASANNIMLGQSVTFINTSTGATTYDWTIDGTSFSSATSPVHQFNSQGVFEVQMEASNGNASCTKYVTETITVTCPIEAAFTSSAPYAEIGATLNFTNTTVGGVSYEWLLDGTSQGTTVNFNHTFPDPGGFQVCLVAYNGTCYDTTCKYIQVGSCPDPRTKHWYFGKKAGIDFNSGTATLKTDGVIDAIECSATISDMNGDMLFYTDGDTVWDKSHNIMLNGTGLFGDQSATQGVMIVPLPGSTTIHCIFTASAALGLRYSIVDVSLNGGLGSVTTKNVLVNPNCDEKLTITKQANRCDFWVISGHSPSQSFYCYPLTSAGLNTTPVVNVVRPLYPGGSEVGQIKVNIQGDKFASAAAIEHNVEIYDFDNATGIMSNRIITTGTPGWIIGCEFSPNGRVLYATSFNFHKIYQWDLSSGDPTTIINSVVEVVPSTPSDVQSLQLAPDGMVYISLLGVAVVSRFENPNGLGAACGYNVAGVILFPGKCSADLPNTLNAFDGPPQISGLDSVSNGICGPYTYSATPSSCSPDSVLWELLGEGTVLSPASLTTDVIYNSPGTDTLVLFQWAPCGMVSDTVIVTIHEFFELDLGPDTAICVGGNILLDAGPGYLDYLWNDLSTNQTLLVNAPGEYSVQVTDSSGCVQNDTVHILPLIPANSLSLGPDLMVCDTEIVVLDAGAGFASYEWQNGWTGRTLTVWLPGTYQVTVIDVCGNMFTDDIVITEMACGGSLPYNEVEFLAIPGRDHVALEWRVTNDDASINYQVFRDCGSTSPCRPPLEGAEYGGGFVGKKEAKTESDNYGLIDQQPLVGLNTYTLYGVDNNGNFLRLSTRSVFFDPGNADMRVVPNPASELIFLTGIEAESVVAVEIMDALGKVITQYPAGTNRLDITQLANGLYFVRLQTENRSYSERFIKTFP